MAEVVRHMMGGVIQAIRFGVRRALTCCAISATGMRAVMGAVMGAGPTTTIAIAAI